MLEFFDGMPTLLRGFWWVAIIASTIFVIQTILTLFGSDHGFDSGGDTDFGGDADVFHLPFQMFTLRNLINFLLGFGWGGVTFYEKIHNSTLLIFIAVVTGLLFVLLFFFIIKQLLKLSEDNTFDINKLVGHTGDVYLTIPGNLSGRGKVQISLMGSNHELQAMTEGDSIPTGATVKVTSVNDEILIVIKI